MNKQIKKKRIWDIGIGILIVIHLVLVTNIFILHKKIAGLKNKQELKTKPTKVLTVKKATKQEKSLQQKIKKNPNNVKMRKDLANLYHYRGNRMGAIHQYQKIIEQNPQTAEAHFKLAQIYMGDKNLVHKAMPYLEKVLHLAPQHPKKKTIAMWLGKLKQQKSQAKKRLMANLKKKLKNADAKEKEKIQRWIEQLQKGETKKVTSKPSPSIEEKKLHALKHLLKIKPNHPNKKMLMGEIKKLENQIAK